MSIQPTVVNGIPTLNSVDVINVGRSFTSEKMTALGSIGQRYIFAKREQLELSFSKSVRGSGMGTLCGRGLERQYQP